jgi:Uma2 family endonuclease
VPPEGVRREHLELPVLLVVEIVSAGGRVNDTVTKRSVYEQAAIEHYWLVDTTRDQPWFTALRLVGGRYEAVLDTDGEAAPDAPASVRFDVAGLFRPPS